MSDVQHDAYQPLEDGRGIFPEDFRVKVRVGSTTP